MKPPKFLYERPHSVSEAVALLAKHDGDAKIIAGGQSLMPMLNFRLLSPEILVDINKIHELDLLEEHEGGLRIGALTRHHTLETSQLVKEKFPILSAAMTRVAHLAIRNRGTIGGSLSHADPAAELPMMMVLLDATFKIAGPNGVRHCAADNFFLGTLTPDLEDDELLIEVQLPALPKAAAWAFEEVSQRSGDFALAAAAATLCTDGNEVADVRIALMGVDETPVRATGAEEILKGKACSDQHIAEAAKACAAMVQPNADLHASAEYRTHLAEVISRRVLEHARSNAFKEAA